MQIKKGDQGVLQTSTHGLNGAVNGWNCGHQCVVVESLENDCLVVFDIESPLVQQIAAQELGYPMGKGFLKIHVSQFRGQT